MNEMQLDTEEQLSKSANMNEVTSHSLPSCMPKGLRRFVASWMFIMTIQVMAQEKNFSEHMKFVRENSDKFPVVVPGIGDPPLSKIHTMQALPVPLEFDGRFYNGFRFDSPDWQDGEVVWIHSRVRKQDDPTTKYSWSIMPEQPDKELSGKLGFSSWDINDNFPYAAKAFPGSNRFTQQIFSRQIVKPGRRYIIWFSFASNDRTEARFAMTLNSPQGVSRWGMLPTGPGPFGPTLTIGSRPKARSKDPLQTAKEALEIFRKSGPVTTEAFLDKEVENHIHSGASYFKFHTTFWKIVQDGDSRRNLEWSAFGFDWLQRTDLKLGAKSLAEELCGNTSSYLMAVRRPGAARLALDPWFRAMSERGLPVDPFDLPEKGTFHEKLPMIQKRSSPSANQSRAVGINSCGLIGYIRDLPRLTTSSLNALASLESAGGDWKRAIERNLWVRDLAEDPGSRMHGREDAWYQATDQIAEVLHSVGLGDCALDVIEELKASKLKEGYGQRSRQLSKLLDLTIRIEHGEASEALLVELDESYQELKGNQYVTKRSWENALKAKALCLVQLGRATEADEILTGLIEEDDNHFARIDRIALRVANGKLDGIENELLTALADLREWGLKMHEIRLFSIYADFLEKSNRLGEAISARREALRLQRSFDLFAQVPVELAKLSAMLRRCGDARGADMAANEATGLAADPVVPVRVAKQVKNLLDAATATAPPEAPDAITSLQPDEALVIPIENTPLRGRLTIVNAGHQRVNGTVSFSGMPVAATWDGVTVKAVIGQSEPSAVNINVEPGSYAMIAIESGVPPPQGKLAVKWAVAGQPDQVSNWTFESAEEGVPAAVIDAGVYRGNAFFGVPIFHHYQHSSPKEASANLRVVATPACRVEMYNGADCPVSIDVDGNGDYSGKGEDFFNDPDTDGKVDFPLENGSAVIRIQVFPPAKIPTDGLKLHLQAWNGTEWSVVAESRIVP